MTQAQVVPVRLSRELLAEVDSRASQASTTRSAVIRAALEAYLAPEELELSLADRRALAEICERYGIAQLELFGSFAQGVATSDSDVDLLYTLKPGARLGWTIEDLAAELAEVFNRPVDLLSRRAVHAELREAVFSDAVVLYAA